MKATRAVYTVLADLLAAWGGCWWPIEITPEWLQKFAMFLPTGWTMLIEYVRRY